MANTVNILGFANTFGDWVVATNAGSNEINSIGKGNWTKDSGTLYLNGGTIGLQVANNAYIQGQLQVQGTGSSAIVQNNLTVGPTLPAATGGGSLYLNNTIFSLYSAGQANMLGTIYATGPNTGLAVSNNVTIGSRLDVANVVNTSTLSVTGNSYTNILQANTSVNTATISATGTAYVNVLQANTTVNTATISATGRAYVNVLQSNTSVNTATISATGTAYVNVLQANTTVNTATISATGTAYVNVLQANTSVNTSTISVTGTSYTNNLQANTSVNTSILSVVNTTYTNILQANTSVNTSTISVTGTSYTNNLQANTSVNTSTISATGTAYVNVLQANNNVNTSTLSVTGTSYTNILQANNTVNTATISATGTAYVNVLQANTSVNTGTLSIAGSTLSAPNATGTFQSLSTTGGVTVGGNFVITGTTVYATNTFTLSANVSSPITSHFYVYRPSSANADFRWNETNKYWDILDVNNSPNYYQVLTSNLISGNSITTSTSTVPTSALLTLAYAQANSASANTIALQGGLNTANANIAFILGVDATQNTWISSNSAFSQAAFNTANNASSNTITLQGGLNSANANIAFILGVDATQNTWISSNATFSQAAFNTANNASANTIALQGGLNTANANIAFILGVDNTQNTWISSNAAFSQAAFNQANTANSTAQAAFNQANTANSTAQAAFIKANNSTANAAQLTGSTLSSNVTISSLTSVGQLISLSIAGGTTANGITANSITANGNVGIGTSSTNGYRVAIVGPATSSVPLYLTTDATNSYIYSPNAMYVGSTGANTLSFVANNIVRASIDTNGNFGVGITPAVRFHVSANSTQNPAALISSALTGTAVRTNTVLRIQSEATGRDVNIQLSDNVTNSAEIGMVGGPMYFATGGSERMRIDTSGNVMVGTTIANAKFSVNNGAAGNLAYFTDNINADFYIKTTSLIATIGPNAGSTSLAFQTAGSERMRIDSSGNVGIGTISPGYKLEANGSFYQGGAYAYVGNFNSGTTGTSPNISSIVFSNNITNGQAESDIWNAQDPAVYTNTGILFTQRLTSSTRRDLMFLHNNGNVGIANTAPNAKLQVNGGIYNSSQAIITTTATLTGSCLGALVEIAGGSSSYTVTLPNPTLYNGGGFQIWLNNTGTITLSTPSGNIYGPSGSGAATQAITQVNSFWYFLASDGFNWALSAVPHLSAAGGLSIGTTTDAGSTNILAAGSITAFSDARIKTNITKIDNALEKVDQLNGYTYDRTDQVTSRQTGVIAQEVLKVLPEAVTGSEDTQYAVAYGNMVGLLIEAIKELKAEIEELKKGK